MAFALTIGGVTQTMQGGSLHVSRTANGQNTFSCNILWETGGTRPTLGADVVLTQDGTAIYGGLLDSFTEQGIDNTLSTVAAIIGINVVDYNLYAQRRFVRKTLTASLAAGTLKSQLTTLVATYLATFGVTLDPAQVDGPSMPSFTFDKPVRLDDFFNQLATTTANAGDIYSWEIDASKVFRMFDPSTRSAPFDISGAPPYADIINDVVVEDTLGDFANRIIIDVDAVSEDGHVETFIGDGVTSTFPLTYTLTKGYGIIHRFVTSTGAVSGGETFGTKDVDFDADGNPTQWWYDPATNTITRNIGASESGYTYKLTFDGTYDPSWSAEDAASIASVGLWEKVITLSSLPPDTTGQALADAYLAKALVPTATVKYPTLVNGFAPGQSQNITIAARNISGRAVVTEIETTDVGDQLHHDITLTIDLARTNLDRAWRDVWKKMFTDNGGAGGGGASVGAAGPSSLGPAPPDDSVQYNNGDGKFGGKSTFTFKKDQNSVICGDASSITATSFDSCQVFGNNCHIAD